MLLSSDSKMLIKLLKGTLGKQEKEAEPAPVQQIVQSDSLFPGAPERSVVLITFGPSRSNPFKSMSSALAAAYGKRGLHCHMLDIREATWPNPPLEALFHENKIRYGLAWGGVGAAIDVVRGDKSHNVWDMNKTPMFKLMGDHPAYFLDLHVSPYPTFVNLYGFAEHCDFYARQMQTGGYAAVFPPFRLDPLEQSQMDFGAKAGGKIVFLKNGNDPEGLRRDWRARLPASVAEMLLSMSEDLLTHLPTESIWRIEELVVRHFADLGVDIASRAKFLSFYIAQLDDYLRRVKSLMIAESLLDFPVEIHGECWEHVDFSGRRASLIPFGDYMSSKELIREALCVVDMSPNTHSHPHERYMRCASRHTLCLTNRSQFLEQKFGAFGQPVFDFTPESIRTSVEAVLADPVRHVEIGRQVGAEYARLYSEDGLVDFTEMMADQIRVQEDGDPEIQKFFVWPPTRL